MEIMAVTKRSSSALLSLSVGSIISVPDTGHDLTWAPDAQPFCLKLTTSPATNQVCISRLPPFLHARGPK
jgi:hypothetical protein